MIRSQLLIATAIVVSSAITACSDSSSTAPKGVPTDPPPARSGSLRLTTDCSNYTGLAGSSCTIATSNLGEIAVGSTVVYASAAGAAALHSDVTITAPGSGTDSAFGHCDIDLVTNSGTCTFSGGTGNLAGFQAEASVAHPGGNIWYWEATYTFPQ